MPWYRKYGKILQPVTDEEFAERMTNGHFATEDHKALPVLLYYSAVRKTEAMRTTRNQFDLTNKSLMFDVGPRLKKIRHRYMGKKLSEKQYQALFKKMRDRITTPPLPLPIDAPFMDLLLRKIANTEEGERVFPWSSKTAYNIVDRAFEGYPHLFRLSRITWFFMPHPEVGRPRGFSIPEVRSFTGLTIRSLDYYIGLADLSDMGRAMYQQQREGSIDRGVSE